MLEKFRSAVVGGLGGIAAAAVGATAAFVGLVAGTAHAADEIGDLAEKIGVNAEALQELRVASELADVPFERLANGLQLIQKNAAEAATGSTELRQAFAGIATRDSNGQIKSADELLMSVAGRFETITNPAQQTALAMKLFGKAGKDLLPLLRRGKSGIEAFRKEAQELGVVFDEDALAAGDDFGRSLTRIKFAFEGLRNAFAVPFLRLFADALAGLSRWLISLRPAFRLLSLAFKDAGERMAGMADTFKRGYQAFITWFNDTALGKLLAQVDGFKSMDSVLKTLEAVLIGLGVVFLAVAAQAIIAWVAAAAPFILLAALIGFIVDELWSYIEGNDSLIGRVIAWADATEKSGNVVLEVFRKVLSVLLDLTDPKKWAALWEAFLTMNQALADGIIAAFKKAFDWIQEHNPLRNFMPAIGQALAANLPGTTGLVRGVASGVGGAIDVASGFLNSPTAQSVAGQVTDSAVTGVAQSFGLAGALPTVSQTNNITVHANGLTPEQAEEAVSRALERQNADAHAAVSGKGSD